MISLTSKNIRLLLCATLAAGAVACGGAEAEQGAAGPQGPVGEQGEQGEPGVDGTDGEPGVDGTDGQDNTNNSLVLTETVEPGEVCANGGVTVSVGIDDNGDDVLDEAEIDATETVCNPTDGVQDLCDEAFAITGISGADQRYFDGQESDPITVETNAASNVSLAFMGTGAEFINPGSDSSFTMTAPTSSESLDVVVIAAGPCGTDVTTFTIDEVEAYLSYLSVVHIYPGAGEVDIELSGSSETVTSLDFAQSDGPLPFDPGALNFDVLADEAMLATTDVFDFAPGEYYTLVAHSVAGDLEFTLLNDDFSAPGDEESFRARFVHMA